MKIAKFLAATVFFGLVSPLLPIVALMWIVSVMQGPADKEAATMSRIETVFLPQ